MIIKDKEKMVFYKEIEEGSPLNTVTFSNLNFDLDKGYEIEWSLNLNRLVGETWWSFLQINGVRNAFSIAEIGAYGSPIGEHLPPKACPDAFSIGVCADVVAEDRPSSGKITIYKNKSGAYPYSFSGHYSWDSGQNYVVSTVGGTIAGSIGTITNISIVGDGVGAGVPNYYGWIKIRRV